MLPRPPALFPQGLDAACPMEPDHPLNVGRVGWWLAGAGGHPAYHGGNKWFDLTPFKNHGTLTNGPTWGGASNRGGWGSIAFDGTSYVVGPDPCLQFNLTGTISLWANLASVASNTAFIGRGTGGAFPRFPWSFGYNTTNGLALLYGDDNGNYTGPFFSWTAVTNVWVHLAVTWTTTASYGYVNGVSVGTGGGNSYTYTGTFGWSLRLAGDNGNVIGFPLNGSLASVSVSNRAWSTAEVAEDYELSQRGYPSVLRRVSPVSWFLPIPTVEGGDGFSLGNGLAWVAA